MIKKTWLTMLLICVPLLLGALASVLVQALWQPVPLMVFKIDIGMAIFVLGVFLTLLLAVYALGVWRKGKQTLRSLAESQRKAEESRRRFLRRLDHEIKNPLTALRTALVNVRESQSRDEQQRATENAGRAVERLIRLLADLRKLSDLGERPLERLSVDMPELLREMVEAAQSLPAFQSREISLLIAKVPSPFPSITGDRDLLSLAVYNLIENALKFTPGNNAVEIRALEDGKAVVIEVADSGPGIPPDELPKIYEDLYRGANARGIEGSGLGLALVQRIVELHGGQIQVRSRREDPSGTVFTVRLPAGK
jgi:two-component system OmpR family sensor kinase